MAMKPQQARGEDYGPPKAPKATPRENMNVKNIGKMPPPVVKNNMREFTEMRESMQDDQEKSARRRK